MQSTANIENVSISIPITDLSFLRTLSKKMGWTIKRPRKSGIDRALDDIKAGRVYEAKSVDDLFDQLEKWNTGSNTPAHSKSHINYVSVEAMIWRMGVSHWIRLASCLDSGKRHDDASIPWYRNSFRRLLILDPQVFMPPAVIHVVRRWSKKSHRGNTVAKIWIERIVLCVNTRIQT